jgi:hypothetical protein
MKKGQIQNHYMEEHRGSRTMLADTIKNPGMTGQRRTRIFRERMQGQIDPGMTESDSKQK